MVNSDFIIFVIEDDLAMRRFLHTGLSAQGFTVFEADTGRQGILEVNLSKPDLVLLDLGLPDMNGVEVIKSLRTRSEVPIIILSACSSEQSKITGLDAGANDYLTKPFGFDELLARIRVALRHPIRHLEQTQSELFVNANLKVDLVKRLVSIDDQEIHLTPIQYWLLTVLVKHAGKVLTHQQILKEVWGPSSQDKAHYLRIYMSQLRQKLETDPTQPRFLRTEAGVGYRQTEMV